MESDTNVVEERTDDKSSSTESELPKLSRKPKINLKITKDNFFNQICHETNFCNIERSLDDF